MQAPMSDAPDPAGLDELFSRLAAFGQIVNKEKGTNSSSCSKMPYTPIVCAKRMYVPFFSATR